MNFTKYTEFNFLRGFLICWFAQETELSLQHIVQIRFDEVHAEEEKLFFQGHIFHDAKVSDYLSLRQQLYFCSPWLFPCISGSHVSARKVPYQIGAYLDRKKSLHPNRMSQTDFDLMETKYRFRFQRQRYQKILALAFLLTCALRPSEVANIKKSDFVFQDRKFVLPETKGGRPAHIPIIPEMIEPLKIYLSYLAIDEYLFRKFNGTPWQAKDVTKAAQQFSKEHKVPDVNSRRLRNTAARVLKDDGATMEQIRVFLRHKDTRTTAYYYAPDSIDDRRKIQEEFNPFKKLDEEDQDGEDHCHDDDDDIDGAGVAINC